MLCNHFCMMSNVKLMFKVVSMGVTFNQKLPNTTPRNSPFWPLYWSRTDIQNSKEYSSRTFTIAFHCVPPQHTQTNGFRHAQFENERYTQHSNKTQKCNLHYNISCTEVHPNNLTNSMKDSPF